jgi:hypothetical protein
LLFDLERPLTKQALGLRCVTEFIANIPTRRNGAIRSSIGTGVSLKHSDVFIKDVVIEDEDIENQQVYAQSARPTVLGPPRVTEPDKPLYLNLERPYVRAGEAGVALCGRLDGELLGYIAI